MTSLHAGGLALVLARAQFGFTIAFHIMFPAFSIGLAAYLAVLELMWLVTKRPVYLDAYRYWLKIFAVIFAIGVVSGLVMAYEVGANWAGYSAKVGPILGPLLAWETMSAFFLEAGFLGIMLFGMSRVGPKLHFAATALVSIGTLISASWILAANSWMQTPRGYALAPDGAFIPKNWLAIIFNPTFPYMWLHMVLAAFIATALAVGAVGAFHLLRNPKNPVSRLMFSMAMWLLTIAVPVQGFVGDESGRATMTDQPLKLAAMEGDFHTRAGQALHLFGWPSRSLGRLLYDVKIPDLGSLIITHKLHGVVQGLDAFPKSDWPVLIPTFWGFRVMVGLWSLMLLLALGALALRRGGRLYENAWFKRFAVAMGPAGFLTIIAGWVVTETGRQPWTVYGVLRTVQSASPLTLGEIVWSFGIIIVLYTLVFGVGIRYVLGLMAHEPTVGEPPLRDDKPLRSHGPHRLHDPAPAPSPAE
ncbi:MULTISPECIES: cytochrome ubiquinol oxidase subunit I [Acidiphilium]|uniref:Putative cytochrome oxidase subunit I n=1 Tax=Acidiphilium multivorum (strain DSM 11245 / JCM 8867 / NBRC 100883 / AIU 301) TaxID=926570 RepID=F0J0U6_ACIMA|nr:MULTISPECIES: cytochrome ubiquinol oxidase subunit I [Acidiphilium]KDM66859.1 cytochrome bd ubiquinol oxidase subunit 1 [Acidiphilium sp. JA12-A1]BAJ81632.1 putative cytochrome oxidase subunit I [Acidiphilium multivorum AIU301]GAN73746.1 cytochrome d ubiquinol oxidase subunit I [Acidiphilium multivorum AIU301]